MAHADTHKGIVLAGGSGTRLGSMTKAVSKQLLPVYDKPMIYYPLSTLIRVGITEILLITNPDYIPAYIKLLGDGSQWGVKIHYQKQELPIGLPHAYLLAEDFLDGHSSVMVLGDNLFYGDQFWRYTQYAAIEDVPCHVFGYPVGDPTRYGVVEWQNIAFDDPEADMSGWRKVKKIDEKPRNPKSRYAVPGLYVFNNKVCELTRELQPSARGELEIADLINLYASEDNVQVYLMNDESGFWFDCGLPESLLDASMFVAATEHRLNRKIGDPLKASNDYNR